MEVNNDKEDNPMRRVAAKGEVMATTRNKGETRYTRTIGK